MKKYTIEVPLLIKRLFASLPKPIETRYANENNSPVLHLIANVSGEKIDITVKSK